MKIQIAINDEKVIKATLIDNETSREFIALLPLNLTLTDYNKTEKISDLPKKLTKKGAPLKFNLLDRFALSLIPSERCSFQSVLFAVFFLSIRETLGQMNWGH